MKVNESMIEMISEDVHNAWWDEKKQKGFHSPVKCPHAPPYNKKKFKAYCSKCCIDMYPYLELPEYIKEYDRVTVCQVLASLDKYIEKLVPPMRLTSVLIKMSGNSQHSGRKHEN